MILKDKDSSEPPDKFGQAGYAAEKQMAFYLRRAFGESPDVDVFNDIRFIRNGEVAQIDHLVLHRFGLVLVESKSVTGSIEVNRQLEFVRTYGRKRTGMKSPLVQVAMQKQLLQSMLNDNKENLRRKVMMGMVQAYFSDERFSLLVAISDQGEIKRKGCSPSELVKADAVAARIHALVDRRNRASGIGGIMRQLLADKKTRQQLEEDELAAFRDEEFLAIRDFLLQNQSTDATDVEAPPIAIGVAPPSPPPPPPVVKTVRATTLNLCKHCEGTVLEIVYGKYGYYFKCRACTKNTTIDFECPQCGNKTRISKSGRVFNRICSDCASEEHFFTNPD